VLNAQLLYPVSNLVNFRINFGALLTIVRSVVKVFKVQALPKLALRFQEIHGFLRILVKRRELSLGQLDSVQLLYSGFIYFLELSSKVLNLGNVLAAADDFFQVLQQPGLVWVSRLGLHQ
jgi:hypothetical protein